MGKLVSLRACNGQYVCAESGGGRELVANRSEVHSWETFKLIEISGDNIALQASNSQYVCAEGSGGREVVANRDSVGGWETFKIIHLSTDTIALRACNGQYVCAEGGGGGKLVADRNQIGLWETFGYICREEQHEAPDNPHIKHALEGFLAKYLAQGNEGEASVNRFEFDGTNVIYEVRLRHHHRVRPFSWAPPADVYDFETTISGSYNPYSVNLGSVKICTELPAWVSNVGLDTHVCASLAEIATVLAGI